MSTTEAKQVETKATFPLDCVYAVKAGMTKIFAESGESIPVTVLDLSAGTFITQVKTQKKDGYSSVQLGFRAKKQQRAKKAEKGHCKKVGEAAFYTLTEFKLAKDADIAPGALVDPAFIIPGKYVDIRGRSKGKGFQGVMKRWNFAGGRDSHGHSVSHRSPGSIGQRQTPGRVQPGKKMAGRMGDEFLTVQNLKVIAFDKEKNLLLVNGAVPGGKNSILRITRCKKKA